jgi:Ca2+-binding RTX toxin-like protein
MRGGADNDRLYGGSSRDVLIEGTGVDDLNGGSTDDVLIGGTTAHNSNAATLQPILNDWRTNLAFGARIAQLGTFLNSSTVIGDGLRDTLYGSSGRDWLLDYEPLDAFSEFQLKPHDGRRKN